jgi:hypothetical protein
LSVFNKIKIATNKGVDVIGKGREEINNSEIKDKVVGFKIDIKELKGGMRRGTREIPPKLNVTASKVRESNI